MVALLRLLMRRCRAKARVAVFETCKHLRRPMGWLAAGQMHEKFAWLLRAHLDWAHLDWAQRDWAQRDWAQIGAVFSFLAQRLR